MAVMQFIGESIMLAFLAGILAVIIVQLSLGAYNKLVGRVLYINFGNPFLVIRHCIYLIYRVACRQLSRLLSVFLPTRKSVERNI